MWSTGDKLSLDLGVTYGFPSKVVEGSHFVWSRDADGNEICLGPIPEKYLKSQEKE